MKTELIKPCTKCNDFRSITHDGDGKCSSCDGTGEVRKIGRPKHKVKCPECNGTGICQACKGFGTI